MDLSKSSLIISPLIYGKLEKAVAIILRIPGLFIIDNYCKTLFNQRQPDKFDHWDTFFSNLGNNFFYTLNQDEYYYFVSTALISGFLLLLLPLEHLRRFYLHLICCILFLLSLCLSCDLLFFDSVQWFQFFPLQSYLNNSQKVFPHFFKVFNQNFMLNLPLFVLHLSFDVVSLALLQESSRTIILG